MLFFFRIKHDETVFGTESHTSYVFNKKKSQNYEHLLFGTYEQSVGHFSMQLFLISNVRRSLWSGTLTEKDI